MDARATILSVACVIGLLSWLSAPDLRPFQVRPIAASEIELFPGDNSALVVPVSTGRAQLAERARSQSYTGVPLRQLHFNLPATDGAWVLLPAVDDDARLSVNGMVGGDSQPVLYFGPGFGPQQLVADLSPSQMAFDDNRIDIVKLSGWHAHQLPLIQVMPAQNGPAFAAMIDQAVRTLRIGALGAGWLGLAASLLGILLFRRRFVWAGGVLFSVAVLDMAFGFAPIWGQAALVLCGLALMAWQWVGQRAWRNPLLGGAMLAALLGLCVGAMFAAGSVTWAWASNVALWPLAGLALPSLAIRDGQQLWGEFIAARTKIRQQAALIVRQEGELQESIRAQAIGEERQRFVRDMHDGVGGHLLSLLMRVRADDADSKEVEAELEKGLTDLRLMADSLDHVGHDLDVALAAFHRRAGQQLSAAGLEFGWTKPERLSSFQMDARAVLNLYRIIQEALSNCIRHAGAGRFAVAFALSEDRQELKVEIEDDGVGFVPDPANEGRGLGNIRKRAGHLDATVSFGAGEGGVGSRIMLTISAAT